MMYQKGVDLQRGQTQGQTLQWLLLSGSKALQLFYHSCSFQIASILVESN